MAKEIEVKISISNLEEFEQTLDRLNEKANQLKETMEVQGIKGIAEWFPQSEMSNEKVAETAIGGDAGQELIERVNRIESKLNALLKTTCLCGGIFPKQIMIDGSIGILKDCLDDTGELEKLSDFLKK